MAELTHIDEQGQATMVDVGKKPTTHRIAKAHGVISMRKETLDLILSGGHQKGDVLAIARISGIMAAKKVPEMVPLCHTIQLTKVEIDLQPDLATLSIRCIGAVETYGQTGVEIEALLAVQMALLTVYDMCKAVDRGMTISDVCLVSKSGGQSGSWSRD